MWWIPLLIFVLLSITTLILIEIRERKRQANPASNNNKREEKKTADSNCCGEHLVCERETLLNSSPQIIYYADEELDSLAGIESDQFTEEQTEEISEVFHSLQETDVIGWARSLQLRNINIPLSLRDEVLLVIKEQRAKSH